MFRKETMQGSDDEASHALELKLREEISIKFKSINQELQKLEQVSAKKFLDENLTQLRRQI